MANELDPTRDRDETERASEEDVMSKADKEELKEADETGEAGGDADREG